MQFLQSRKIKLTLWAAAAIFVAMLLLAISQNFILAQVFAGKVKVFVMSQEFLSFAILIAGLLGVFALDRYRLPIMLATAGVLFTWAMINGLGEEYHHLWHEIYSPLILETLAIMAVAMTIVGVLNRGGGLFAVMRGFIAKRAKTDASQMNLTDIMTWMLSYVIDNMTVTVGMGILIRKFYGNARKSVDNLHIASARVIAMSNAGGAASPVGDITTILMWIAGFVNPLSLTMYALLPSIVYLLIIRKWFASRITSDTADEPVVNEPVNLTFGQKMVNILGLLGFGLPVVFMAYGGLAIIGLMISLSVVLFVYIRFCKNVHTHDELEVELEHLFGEIDTRAWVFIFSALIAVFSLQLLGGTDIITPPADISFVGAIVFVIFMGLLSGVVENVALVLLMIVTMPVAMNTYPGLADLICVAAGVGANWNLLGSVPGAIMASQTPGLTSRRYLQIAAAPNLLAYAGAILTWLALTGIYTVIGWR